MRMTPPVYPAHQLPGRAAHVFMPALARFFDWREVRVIVKPATAIG
jgi:hypothetical protein